MAGTVRAQPMEPEELPMDAPATSAPPRPLVLEGDGPEDITPVAAKALPPAVNRSARGGGLDDIFGMGAEASTRIRIPKAAEGETKPRRPMVTEPPPGIDRRPPPPKPPLIKASSSAPPSDDLPDE